MYTPQFVTDEFSEWWGILSDSLAEGVEKSFTMVEMSEDIGMLDYALVHLEAIANLTELLPEGAEISKKRIKKWSKKVKSIFGLYYHAANPEAEGKKRAKGLPEELVTNENVQDLIEFIRERS